jgi:hypothetical protein
MSLSAREEIELQQLLELERISNYAPVLILEPGEIEEHRHLIGPDTVVIVDDIPRASEGLINGI